MVKFESNEDRMVGAADVFAVLTGIADTDIDATDFIF